MKQLLSLISILIIIKTGFSQTTFVKESIYFKSNKHQLNKDHVIQLELLGDSVSRDKLQGILVQGFADSDADSIFNMKLSMKRVSEVKNYLIESGFDSNMITMKFFGENLAGADNISEELKSRNRRVDITFTYLQKLPKPSMYVKDTCQLGDTTIELKNGTQFVLNTCYYRSQTDNLVFTEALSVEQMLEQGLTTNTSGEGQLISSGMFTIGTKNGDCYFKDSIKVRIPIGNGYFKKECMKIFLSGNSAIWMPSMLRYTIENSNNKIFFVFKINKCIKGNIDFKLGLGLNISNCITLDSNKEVQPKIVPIYLINGVRDYVVKKIEIYNDTPMLYWRFKRMQNDTKKVLVIYPANEYKIKIWIQSLKNKNDTLVCDWVPLKSLKHRAFGGYPEINGDNTVKFLFFNIPERKLYKKYWIRKELFEDNTR